MAGDILKIYFISFAYHNSYTGPPRAWLGPGANFFRAPISKFFPEKNFFGQPPPPPPPPPPPAFQRLYLNFSYQISVLCPKKPQISCPLRGNISPKKITGAQQKNSRGPQNLGARGNFPPCPLSAALLIYTRSFS